MKKILLAITTICLLFVYLIPQVNAQMMNRTASPSAALSQEDQQDISAGQKLYTDLKYNKTSCKNLKDTDFDKIGEYVMEQQIGNSAHHAQMNAMMKQMMGENGEEQIHIALGKKATGCDTNAGTNYYPGWRGGGRGMMGYGWNHMDGWGGYGLFGGVFMLIFWIVIIVLLFWLFRSNRHGDHSSGKEKTPLEILKERYAKGEIDKKEFEEKKKDIL